MVMLQMQVMIIYVCLNNFRKNQRNKIKMLSRKCNSTIKRWQTIKKQELH